MRRASTCLALLGLAVLGLSGRRVGGARRHVQSEGRADSRASPDTGNILGAGAAVEVECTIKGTEYRRRSRRR